MKHKFSIGEKVLCYEPDESKARVLYNAKIMDADVLKDSKGKKHVEYKIHFQGWNHAWDRWADEALVLKDDEQNRKLQRKLARKAIRKLGLQKGKKRRHLPGVGSKQESGPTFQDGYSTDDSSDSDFSGKLLESGDCSVPSKKFASTGGKYGYVDQEKSDESLSKVKEELPSRRLVSLEISIPLRQRLEYDFTMIKNGEMLVNLPISPNVIQILDNYVKKFAQNYFTQLEKQKFSVASSGQQNDLEVVVPPEKRLKLCQELCCDVKLLFDYALPLTLLYIPERKQLKSIAATTKFCKMEEIYDNIPESKVIEEAASQHRAMQSENLCVENTEQVVLPSSSSLLDDTLVNERIITQQPHLKPPTKKKNAEAQLIEETHKYLIPNQPNLDQTGLSKDSQGRRRSSRLSHQETTNFSCTYIDNINVNESKPSDLIKTSDSLSMVSLKRLIFLRAPSKRNFSNLVPSGVMATSSPQLSSYCKSRSIDKNSYVTSCGNEMKTVKDLERAWEWSILPQNYEPENGAAVPPSMIYGIHHLLRFFVKLPDIMVKMEIPEFKVRIIMKHLQGLLRFLNEYERELFEIDQYIPAQSWNV